MNFWAQREVEQLVRDLVEAPRRSGRGDRGTGRAARLADRLKRVVDVGSRLHVHGDAVRAGPGDVRDVALGTLDHQMHVDHGPGRVHLLGDGVHHQRPKGDRGHEVAVHHVDMDDLRAGREHLGELIAQPGKVGGEDRGGEPALAQKAVRRLGGAGLGGHLRLPAACCRDSGCRRPRPCSTCARSWSARRSSGTPRRARIAAGSRRIDTGREPPWDAATAPRTPGTPDRAWAEVRSI
jgi:hypothetical protein